MRGLAPVGRPELLANASYGANLHAPSSPWSANAPWPPPFSYQRLAINFCWTVAPNPLPSPPPNHNLFTLSFASARKQVCRWKRGLNPLFFSSRTQHLSTTTIKSPTALAVIGSQISVHNNATWTGNTLLGALVGIHSSSLRQLVTSRLVITTGSNRPKADVWGKWKRTFNGWAKRPATAGRCRARINRRRRHARCGSGWVMS